jgi:actin-related protein 6
VRWAVGWNELMLGIQQAGLAETIALVIGEMPEAIRGMFWAHIGVFGGLGNLEALGERL